MPPKCLGLRADDPNDISVCLCIAVFHEAAYFEIILPPTLIDELSAKGIELSIVTYPCREDDPDRDAAAERE